MAIITVVVALFITFDPDHMAEGENVADTDWDAIVSNHIVSPSYTRALRSYTAEKPYGNDSAMYAQKLEEGSNE
jgi:hypothetical protein